MRFLENRDPLENIYKQPDVIAHADWSISPQKRQVAAAVLEPDGKYHLRSTFSATDPAQIISRLLKFCNPDGHLLLGLDIPIGLPTAYARQVGITDFLSALPLLGNEKCPQFYQVANTPDEITLCRPFYPQRPGHARISHLLGALNIPTISDLRRSCEHGHPNRRPASPIFWTMGAQQVGKAAINGWKSVLVPGLTDPHSNLAIWPFSGTFGKLLETRKITIAETYPAEFYGPLNIHFRKIGATGSAGKRSVTARQAQGQTLLSWLHRLAVELPPEVTHQILTGFDDKASGEDGFDATIGVIGLISCVLGLFPIFEPVDPEILQIEGWILGQTMQLEFMNAKVFGDSIAPVL